MSMGDRLGHTPVGFSVILDRPSTLQKRQPQTMTLIVRGARSRGVSKILLDARVGTTHINFPRTQLLIFGESFVFEYPKEYL